MMRVRNTGLGGPALRFLSRGAERKSAIVAYLVWLVSGLLGAHRLYLGRPVSAAGMCGITLVSLALAQTGIGLLGFAATGAWAMADLLLIPEMAREGTAADAVGLAA
jgi:TM2 domain-containing membrane protein YozV